MKVYRFTDESKYDWGLFKKFAKFPPSKRKKASVFYPLLNCKYTPEQLKDVYTNYQWSLRMRYLEEGGKIDEKMTTNEAVMNALKGNMKDVIQSSGFKESLLESCKDRNGNFDHTKVLAALKVISEIELNYEKVSTGNVSDVNINIKGELENAIGRKKYLEILNAKRETIECEDEKEIEVEADVQNAEQA